MLLLLLLVSMFNGATLNRQSWVFFFKKSVLSEIYRCMLALVTYASLNICGFLFFFFFFFSKAMNVNAVEPNVQTHNLPWHRMHLLEIACILCNSDQLQKYDLWCILYSNRDVWTALCSSIYYYNNYYCYYIGLCFHFLKMPSYATVNLPLH